MEQRRAAHKAPPVPGSAASFDAHMLLVVARKYHEVRSVFAVQQLCQCATDSLCDWLKLMEGAGLSLIAYTKLTRVSRWCLGFISKPVIT